MTTWAPAQLPPTRKRVATALRRRQMMAWLRLGRRPEKLEHAEVRGDTRMLSTKIPMGDVGLYENILQSSEESIHPVVRTPY